jgi:positive regulator of sigma E activity
MTNEKPNQPAINAEVSWSSATIDILSPKKLLVESATMIYIIAFILFSFVVLVWKGPALGTSAVMAMFFGLILTSVIAIRQYASFRY